MCWAETARRIPQYGAKAPAELVVRGNRLTYAKWLAKKIFANGQWRQLVIEAVEAKSNHFVEMALVDAC